MKPSNNKKLVVWLIIIFMFYLFAVAGCKQESTNTDSDQIMTSWSVDSSAKMAIIEYVQSVTNEDSEDYIPVEDRIAVFDQDGTIMAEGTNSATVLGVAVTLYRVEEMIKIGGIGEGNTLYDNYQALQQQLTDDPTLHKYGTDLLYAVMGGAFDSMPVEDYINYVSDFMATPHPDFDIVWSEAFYQPMIELIDYLKANDFTVYIVSGSERMTLWGANQGVIDLPRSQIIGSDINLYGSTQVFDSREFSTDDDLLRQRTYYGYNFNNTKVFNIYRQIGKNPVMAFGNSNGDYPMINYTTSNDNYRTFAGLLIHDDGQREYEYNTAASLAACEENSWTPISITDDFMALWMNK